MVQQYRTVTTSDLSGVEITEGAGETLTFSVGRTSYTIDLTDDEVGAFYDALKPYTEVARRGEGAAYAPKAKSSAPKQDLSAVREWANANGFTVSSRGRVPSNVLDAYQAAH